MKLKISGGNRTKSKINIDISKFQKRIRTIIIIKMIIVNNMKDKIKRQ